MKKSTEWINRGKRKSSRLYNQRMCFSHVHDAEILRSRSLASPWSHSTSHKALLGGLLPRKFRACWCHAATVDISRSTPQVCSVCRDSHNGGARRGTSQNCTNRRYFSSLRSRRYAIEQTRMSLEAGVLGKNFGSSMNAPTNIAGFVVGILTLTIIVAGVMFMPSKISVLNI